MKLLITWLCLDGAHALIIARDVHAVDPYLTDVKAVGREEAKVQKNTTTIYCIGECLPLVHVGWKASAVMIVSGSNQEREWSNQIRENHRLYAEFHGYRYMYAYTPGWKNMSSDKEPQWLKVLVLLACLQDTHLQYVLWVDDDIVFTTKSNFLSTLIDDLHEKNLLIARDIRLDQVNTGIMLFRRCQESINILVRLWQASNSRLGYCREQSCFHEQEALNTLIDNGEVDAQVVNPVNELYNLNTMWRISHFDEARKNLLTGRRMYLDYDENDPPGQRWRWGMNMAHVSGMTPVCRAAMLKMITEYTRRVVFGFRAAFGMQKPSTSSLDGPSAMRCTHQLGRKSTLLEQLRWFPNTDLSGDTRMANVNIQVDYSMSNGVSAFRKVITIKDNFTVRVTGQLIVRDEGEYEFFTMSSNGSSLKINGAQIANTSGRASIWTTASLPIGHHSIALEFPNQTRSSSGLMFAVNLVNRTRLIDGLGQRIKNSFRIAAPFLFDAKAALAVNLVNHTRLRNLVNHTRFLDGQHLKKAFRRTTPLTFDAKVALEVNSLNRTRLADGQRIKKSFRRTTPLTLDAKAALEGNLINRTRLIDGQHIRTSLRRIAPLAFDSEAALLAANLVNYTRLVERQRMKNAFLGTAPLVFEPSSSCFQRAVPILYTTINEALAANLVNRTRLVDGQRIKNAFRRATPFVYETEAALPLPPRGGSSALTILASGVLLLVALGIKSQSLEKTNNDDDDCSHVTALGNTSPHERPTACEESETVPLEITVDDVSEDSVTCGSTMQYEAVETAEPVESQHSVTVEPNQHVETQLANPMEATECMEPQMVSPVYVAGSDEPQVSAEGALESVEMQLSSPGESMESQDSEVLNPDEMDSPVESQLPYLSDNEPEPQVTLEASEVAEPVEDSESDRVFSVEAINAQSDDQTAESGEAQSEEQTVESFEAHNEDQTTESSEVQNEDQTTESEEAHSEDENTESDEAEIEDQTTECDDTQHARTAESVECELSIPLQSCPVERAESASSVDTTESVETQSSIDTVESLELQSLSPVELQLLNSSSTDMNIEGDFVLVEGATNQTVDFAVTQDSQEDVL